MVTDRPPRRVVLLSEFRASDTLTKLSLPEDNRLREPAKALEAALKSEDRGSVRKACTEFLAAAADFYHLPQPAVRVLAARPLRVREGGSTVEYFGDYDPKEDLIRVWMRTAVRRQVTSFGTFFSTLCHEFCHHLDYKKLGFRDSPHTRGFYERTGALYHHARGTPPKHLVWAPLAGGRWRIDWSRTNRQAREEAPSP
jgi:hypothetical protein